LKNMIETMRKKPYLARVATEEKLKVNYSIEVSLNIQNMKCSTMISESLTDETQFNRAIALRQSFLC
jgi:hypothetical protein